MTTGAQEPEGREPGGIREQSPAPPPQRPSDGQESAAEAPPPGTYRGRHEAGGTGSGSMGATPQPPPPSQYDTGYGAGPGDFHVTGRRIVQYLIDGFVSGLLATLAYAVFAPLAWAPTNADGSLAVPLLGGVALGSFAVVSLLLVLAYWVGVPSWAGGQTFGMKLLGIKVVRAEGGEASWVQHLVRWILLIIDGIFAGLVGWVIMLVSERRQRLGDMAAGTLVVRKY